MKFNFGLRESRLTTPAVLFHELAACFHPASAGLGPCDRDHMVPKGENIYYLGVPEKVCQPSFSITERELSAYPIPKMALTGSVQT